VQGEDIIYPAQSAIDFFGYFGLLHLCKIAQTIFKQKTPCKKMQGVYFFIFIQKQIFSLNKK